MDEQHLETPCFGSRQMTRVLRREGLPVNRKRIQRLMRLMGLEAIYPKKKTTIPCSEHKIYPYLLRGREISEANEVWCADITYIPMQKGFFYLVAIMDWHSRKILSWRLSNSLEADFCVDALEEALARYPKPEIFNTDQGSQFTSEAFLEPLQKRKIKISMDGKGRWIDNVRIERFWRSLKYEEVYLKAYENGSEARKNLRAWIWHYNQTRPHSSLGIQTPDERYFGSALPKYRQKQVA
jgi:putative transposase